MASFVKLSEACTLAIHTMAFLACDDEGKLSARELSVQLKASFDHLSKVLQRLTKADLVRPVRGPQGGFVLARPAGEINLLEVVESIEGRMEPSSCPLSKPFCPTSGCTLGCVMKDVEAKLSDHYSKTSLEQLCQAIKKENR